YTNFEFHGRCSFIVVLSLNKTLKESALFFNPSYISHNKCYTTTADEYLQGWLMHYNYFRNHESLNDRTPAQVAGVRSPYANWLDVVKAQQVRLAVPKTVSKTLVIPARLPRVTTKRTTNPHRKPPTGGLYMGKQGQMSRHYFKGARRVR
ncbi:MAG: integrase core domain-containing protein, partial [Dehalococcoidales bacterium]|nr:integrase core domain-containing protein [Dehalococcoidales bacterium]